MTFSERLFNNIQSIWNQNHQHPFVQGIGKGTLPKEMFQEYMKQDYVYLIQYAKLYAIGVQKANDLASMTHFAQLLHNILHFEMNVHREYASQFGITTEELEQTKPTPNNLAYTSYMLSVAQNGTLAELISCLLPCAWDYWEIGKLLKKQYGHQLENNPYKTWIETYSSDEFGSIALWLIKLLDEITIGKSEDELAVLENHFQITSKYEYLFWEMLMSGQDWPL
ncbi:thiaminase II [Heyndrickxia shackletonii]|uniref:Aminopyrimidine aminohydrolase n=1 Tax=Heyndrickxia shackletonii TaxID=157838 RepID=A0A0Q3TL11_9BACI|nr:thiaminase II [Heyndrickxia shackletonii]KQL54313.1 thiaminase II [Heyndrickxia shackletonii]NEZ01204.1 thiaminase II [Heyndrickxia shackletonii]